jgi:hypothetical protein
MPCSCWSAVKVWLLLVVGRLELLEVEAIREIFVSNLLNFLEASLSAYLLVPWSLL